MKGFPESRRIISIAVVFFSISLRAQAASSDDQALAEQILQTMLHVPGTTQDHRPVHAKGIFCEGTFTPSPAAAGLSTAGHFQKEVPVTVRFSDGATDPMVRDNVPEAGPRGLAIRFNLPGGAMTDIVAMSHNGFVVSNGEEFLTLQKAVVATDPTKPHPWPVEEFLGAHPAAMKFVKENAVVPDSFATEAFFSNDSFVFVNKEGKKQAGRYQFIPVTGVKHLEAEEAKGRGENYLHDEIKTRLSGAPVEFRLVVQLPNAGDSTADPSVVWPDDRKKIEVGTIRLTSARPDENMPDKDVAFDPAKLVPGIGLSDDGLPALRSKVYALSVKHRRGGQ